MNVSPLFAIYSTFSRSVMVSIGTSGLVCAIVWCNISVKAATKLIASVVVAIVVVVLVAVMIVVAAVIVVALGVVVIVAVVMAVVV